MYGSIDEADSYWEYDLSDTWADFTTVQKENALEEASRQIDRLPYQGEKYQLVPDQTLQFPRILKYAHKTVYWDYDLADSEVVVPSDVKTAVFIQAKYLLDYWIKGDKKGEMQKAGISSLSIGSTSESYDKSISPVDVRTGVCREAMELLSKYMLWGW